MKIYYRISDSGYKKIKPDYINNENCLRNFVDIFKNHINNIHIIADNICAETYNIITKYVLTKNIEQVRVGHGAGTFNLALDRALLLNEKEIVYFVENDYLHLPNSPSILQEGISLGFPYVSLYDHPDKYMDPKAGGNPYCNGGAENTRVYLTDSCHWKITNSTTMTFAARVNDLKRDETILRQWTSGSYPDDFKMFLDLRNNNRFLISSIPGYATHGETHWLSPLINWNNYVY